MVNTYIMSQPFGAYLQCHKNPFATYKCLESFRYFYPNATIVLLSDNGYNFSEMSKYFNCIYIHENENIWLTHKNLDDGSHITNSNKLIERISRAFQLVKEDFIMWLEDDVSINNIIQDNFKYDLNGFSPNQILDFQIEELKKKYTFLDKNKIYRFNGHGGSVFHKTNFLDFLKNKEIIDDVLINWKKYKFSSDLGQDFFFSVIITLNRGTIGAYEGHYDFGGYRNNNIIVQHQYKVWYNHKMPKELEYLVQIT
jgi:hypothetical protein